MSRSPIARILLWTALVGALAVASFARQPDRDAPDLTGKYLLEGGGYLVVSVDDLGRVEGFFERDGEFGRMSGWIEGGVAKATWVQQNGPHACAGEVAGSRYWGRVTVTRTADDGLGLAWGTCVDLPARFETAR